MTVDPKGTRHDPQPDTVYKYWKSQKWEDMDGNVGVWKEILKNICRSLAVKHAGFYQNAAKSNKHFFFVWNDPPETHEPTNMIPIFMK